MNIEKQKLKLYIKRKLSQRKIANIYKCSQGKIKYWLCKYNLQTNICRNIKRTEKQKRKSLSIKVQKRRKKIRLMAISLLGGKCSRCGYDKCYEALDFHHKNGEKDFAISSISKSWKSVLIEIKKCILLCANCHREEHVRLRKAALSSNG